MKNQKSIVVTLAISLVLVTLSALGQSEYAVFSDKTAGFSVSMPKTGWRQTPSQSTVSYVSQNLDALASIVVNVEEGRVNLPLSQNQLMTQVSSVNTPQTTVMSADFTKIDGYNAAKLVIRVNLGETKETEQTQWHYILPLGGKTVHLMFTSKTDLFPQNERVFGTVLDSFKVAGGGLLSRIGSGTIFDNVVRNTLIAIAISLIIGALSFLLRKTGAHDKTRASGEKVDEKDIVQLKTSFSEKSTDELKTIYAKRDTDEYRPEAIEAVRRILTERGEAIL